MHMHHQPCDAEPPEATAGYCECGGGRRVPRPPRCGAAAAAPGASSSCTDECARGESLYETLGLAEGATDSALKKARAA